MGDRRRPVVRRVLAAKANPTRGDRPTPDAVIEIVGQLPHFEDLARARQYFRDEAEAIYAALGAALPGGTIDALFGVMALDKATVFHVTHRAPGATAPDDDVPDVYIHEATCEHRDGCTACVRELRAQRAAVLQAHAPCHTGRSGTCALGHEDPHTGAFAEPAECTTCTYDDRVVLHPCPTAAALGVALPFPASGDAS